MGSRLGIIEVVVRVTVDWNEAYQVIVVIVDLQGKVGE